MTFRFASQIYESPVSLDFICIQYLYSCLGNIAFKIKGKYVLCINQYGYCATFGPTIQVTYEGPGFFHQKLAKRLSFTSPEWASLIHLTQTKLIGPVYDA